MSTAITQFSQITSGFRVIDAGLEFNREQGRELHKRGEVMQYDGYINGVHVWIRKSTGGIFGWSCNYYVAFDDAPETGKPMDCEEALQAIRRECDL